MSGLQGKSQVVQDELSRLDEREWQKKTCDLSYTVLEAAASTYSNEESPTTAGPYSGEDGDLRLMLLPTVQAQSFADLFLYHLALFIYSKVQVFGGEKLTSSEDSENAHIHHSELFTLTEKMSGSVLCPSMLPEADTTHMELLDLEPLPVTALANGTYEELYRFTHFNPIQTEVWMKLASPPWQDELSRLGEQMVHSSEGKRALARCSKHGKNRIASPGGPECQAEERAYPETVLYILSKLTTQLCINDNLAAAEHPPILMKVYLTITLEKMAKGDAQKLYFTALTTYMELLDLKPLPVTALANGTYEELYRYIHFNPIQTKTPGQDELSRLGEKMVHSSEGKRALARVLCHELHDKFLQHAYRVAQSMERIEELLQEDQNVKRRKERIQKQSSILSKLTTQLCINDNLAAAASTYSNEGDLFYDYKSVYSYKFKVQPLLAHLPGSSGDATFDAAASGPNLSYGDSRSNCLSRRNSDPFHNGDINPGADEHPSICHLLLHHLHLFIYSKVYLTITLEKMAKGDAQKLYFTALTTYMELLDLKPLPVTALANGTYEELYRYIHFNPIQTKVWMKLASLPCCFPTTPGQDELSRLGEKMVHSSEGKRALARVLCHELHDKFLQHAYRVAQSMERIEELLQEDQNVKRRKERIQKQSSILSKLTTQLCINDNLAAAASTYSNEGDLFYDYKSVYSYKFKVQPLLAHLPGSSGDATFDAAASGPNLSYGDSRSNCLSRRNSDPFHNGDINPGADEHPSICHLLLHHLHLFIYSKVYLTITLEKMAKGDAQKLYFTALTTYMELLDLKPLPVTALANGTYEELYRYIHFNPIQTKAPGQVPRQDELSRLGEKMVHSSEGKRALARVLCHELHDKFLQHAYRVAQSMERIEELLQEDQNVKRRKERIQKQSSILSKLTTQLCINDNLAAAASTYSNEGDLFYDYKSVYSYKFKVQPLLAHLPGSSGDATFDAAASGPNLSYGDSRSNCLSRRNSDPFHNGDINPGADEHPSICHLLLHHLHLFIYSKVYLTITLEKMAKGDAQKLYFTALTTYMELLDLKPLPVTALANGTYEELYRYIHFNPIQTKTPGQDELSRLGEKMVHSSEGKRALARVLCHEFHDKFLQHGLYSGIGQRRHAI
ncbi:hypothetical protein SASPL_133403 [Salvia splendens]|uniref:Dynamin GTPase n=1 Tax=Salvia splendens TaxID=180675 RepID=A0A8X8ZJ31_SALSN|nr:hypothetical protein SASPL_133403 [Salvia splendens]